MSAAGQEVSVDVQDIVTGLQTLHAQQLGAANLEAARWQAIAAAAQRRIAELERERDPHLTAAE